jgi:hypothetical protein
MAADPNHVILTGENPFILPAGAVRESMKEQLGHASMEVDQHPLQPSSGSYTELSWR